MVQFVQVCVVVRDQYIDVFIYFQYFVYQCVIWVFDSLYCGGWQIVFLQCLLDYFYCGGVGVSGFFFVVQDCCVVGFQIQGGDVDCYVRMCFINYVNYFQWDVVMFNMQIVVQQFVVDYLVDWIGQIVYLVYIVGDVVQMCWGQCEVIEYCFIQVIGVSFG